MLTMADGTQFECSFFGLAGVGILYIDIIGIGLADAISVFTDTSKTSRMTYEAGEETVVRDGFTVCLGANLPSAEQSYVRVSVRKPYADEL